MADFGPFFLLRELSLFGGFFGRLVCGWGVFLGWFFVGCSFCSVSFSARTSQYTVLSKSGFFFFSRRRTFPPPSLRPQSPDSFSARRSEAGAGLFHLGHFRWYLLRLPAFFFVERTSFTFVRTRCERAPPPIPNLLKVLFFRAANTVDSPPRLCTFTRFQRLSARDASSSAAGPNFSLQGYFCDFPLDPPFSREETRSPQEKGDLVR